MSLSRGAREVRSSLHSVRVKSLHLRFGFRLVGFELFLLTTKRVLPNMEMKSCWISGNEDKAGHIVDAHGYYWKE